MTMWNILHAEMRRLKHEESGVALMLTLSVFLLLYVVCAGVYSIGETVRQKTELQNACDSAAYSAAVAQADGLSRMAMINRAMSWTYVQLTNMQIDYITYRWLQLVLSRFDEDKAMCKQYNSATFGGSIIPYVWPFHEHRCAANAELSQPVGDYSGAGWFCGIAGVGMDYVRLNDADEPIKTSDISSYINNSELAQKLQSYGSLIPTFKELIDGYHINLIMAMKNMLASMNGTAMAILMQNLPRDANGNIDSVMGRDFLGHVAMTYPTDPYSDEGGGYFLPLYNTELGERLFLTMADGEVYDELADYFGSSGDNDHRFGGLDQWFVRSFEDESALESPYFDKKEYGDFKHNSISARGICRVYKNTNRRGEVKYSSYRDHHHAVGAGDSIPSCVNTHLNCPEQCQTVADSVALYADYEWSSGRYSCDCTHLHHYTLSGDPCDIHFHTYSTSFLSQCNRHQCGIPSGISHARQQYRSCVANGKGLDLPDTPTNLMGGSWPSFMLLDCGGIPVVPYSIMLEAAYLPLVGEGFWGSVSDSNWNAYKISVRYSNKYKPNGFSRIYGDDREIFSKTHYCGAVAMPLILNDSFYGKEGAIVVGLARKQRNPWTVLLNGIASVIESDKSDADGIYSAFNPVKDNYIVAFSAGRAGHRFHPSTLQVAKASQAGSPLSVYAMDGATALPGEYETRFDSVCEEDNFSIVSTKSGYSAVNVGCVCRGPVSRVFGAAKGNENVARLSRCWNLCETDWDATLLPLRFALAEPDGELFDSLNGENISWETVGIDRNNLNPLQNAAKDDKWVPFFDSDGEPILDTTIAKVSGGFLVAQEPVRIKSGKTTAYDAPYSQVDVNAAAVEEGEPGKLKLGTAIMNKIL